MEAFAQQPAADDYREGQSEMSDNGNLRHWEALCETDRKATKPFDKGRFKGTSTNPVWREWLLTQHFGPCGIGWGMNHPEFTLVPAGDELVVFCTVALWYSDQGDKAGYVYGVGGDKVVRIEKNGPFISDEAYKAAFTDALGNAMKHLGVSADIYSGEFDADKYTRPTPAATRAATSAGASRGPSSTGERQPQSAGEGRTLSQIRDSIHKALSLADSVLLVDDILRVNQAELALINGASKLTHSRLLAYAERRKAELAQPAANGSALAGEVREALGQP
jgi:hypothetical protein